MSQNYGSWDLPMLRTELKSRGARVSGRKAELIERLEAYDRNKDFGREVMEEEFNMFTPECSTYKDINNDSDFVDIKFSAIEAYLDVMNKTIDTDATNLYKQRFLKYIRLSSFNNTFYVHSVCHAQMKKTTTYKLDVAIDTDGSIIEAQCECAAGMGPNAHCKHVCALLFALYKYCSCGDIFTEETCTQRLQTFHQCKPYSGSPIKTSDLPLANEKISVNFDPRPLEYRNIQEYNDYFRNTCINHCGINKLPISQLFPPANPYAVDLDHDYLQEQLSDRWLKLSKTSEISDDDIREIEKSTIGQSKNNVWLTERCKRLHSSKFGRICKATEKTNFHILAKSLTTISKLSTPPIVHGKKYESVALNKYSNETESVTISCGIFVSKLHPYIAASPDALLQNSDKLVEVKCPYSARNGIISEETIPYLKNIDGKLHLATSSDYFYQIQGQLFCTGKSECDLVIYTFNDLKIINVKQDQDFTNNMVDKLSDFYNKYFKRAVLEKFFFKEYSRYSF